MFNFVCQAFDDSSNPISGGCGEQESVIISLKGLLDRAGEGRFISMSKSGNFFFTPEQKTLLPKSHKHSEIIELVEQWSGKGSFLHFGGCPTKDCKHSVRVIQGASND